MCFGGRSGCPGGGERGNDYIRVPRQVLALVHDEGAASLHLPPPAPFAFPIHADALPAGPLIMVMTAGLPMLCFSPVMLTAWFPMLCSPLSQAPLMIGCDLRIATPTTLEILGNKEVVAINQGTPTAHRLPSTLAPEKSTEQKVARHLPFCFPPPAIPFLLLSFLLPHSSVALSVESTAFSSCPTCNP